MADLPLMDPAMVPASQIELAAAYLQLAVTLGLVLLCVVLNSQYRNQYFVLWAFAWAIYSFGLVAFISFLAPVDPVWFFLL